MRIAVEFRAPHAIVDGPLGTRRILHVANGKFEGPALHGKVLPDGGDWVVVRRDGSAELDIRFTLQTAEGAIVYFRSTGLFVASDSVAMRIRNAESVPPDDFITSGPRFCSRRDRQDQVISIELCTSVSGKEQLPA
jgi:hypothetical protein